MPANVIVINNAIEYTIPDSKMKLLYPLIQEFATESREMPITEEMIKEEELKGKEKIDA